MFYQTPTMTATQKPSLVTSKKFLLTLILFSLVLLIMTFFLGRLSVSPLSSSSSQVSQPAATHKQTVNKIFSFPVKDNSGRVAATLSYKITDVTEQNEIIIQGEKATAIAGKTFFIVNEKITNPSPQGIQINARDFVRLSVNGSKEQLAADIHSDPVSVQAISTKYTRLGFPVNTTDKNFVLTVGEINGQKTTIPITFGK